MLTGISMLAVPLTIQAKQYIGARITIAFRWMLAKIAFGKSISLFEGDTFYCKVSSKDTDGDIYMFESVRVKEGGPALHTHYIQMNGSETELNLCGGSKRKLRIEENLILPFKLNVAP